MNALGTRLQTRSLPVGSYHTPFFDYPVLNLGPHNHKVGYANKGVWYEPTGALATLHGSSNRNLRSACAGWQPGSHALTTRAKNELLKDRQRLQRLVDQEVVPNEVDTRTDVHSHASRRLEVHGQVLLVVWRQPQIARFFRHPGPRTPEILPAIQTSGSQGNPIRPIRDH